MPIQPPRYGCGLGLMPWSTQPLNLSLSVVSGTQCSKAFLFTSDYPSLTALMAA